MNAAELKDRVEEIADEMVDIRLELMMEGLFGMDTEELERKRLTLALEWADLMRAGAPNPDGMEDGPGKDQFLAEFREGVTVDELYAEMIAMREV